MMTITRKLPVILSLLFTTACGGGLAQENLSTLGEKPDWSNLTKYYGTITRERFEYLLENVYVPYADWSPYIRIMPEEFHVKTEKDGERWLRVPFAPSPAAAQPLERYWQSPRQMDPAPKNKPLAGVHIALDPGHLGGRWSKIEERWFQIGDDKPIEEGNMVLTVAKLLETRLERMGAKVSYTRKNDRPSTRLRPEDLHKQARFELAKDGIRNPPLTYTPGDPRRGRSVRHRAELLFYRTAEIGARAREINEKIRPDLVLALHFNAEAWGDPANPTLTNRSHLHLLINGAYMAEELAYDDQRYEMLIKLLNGSHDVELDAARFVAARMARDTGLPAYTYHGKNASRAEDSKYVWQRNLRANRLFQAPTLFLEPYIMNNRLDYARMQMGAYGGVRNINGRLRKSIFHEYADSVAAGVAEYYQARRGR